MQETTDQKQNPQGTQSSGVHPAQGPTGREWPATSPPKEGDVDREALDRSVETFERAGGGH